MSAGFSYAGNLVGGGAAPLVRKFLIGETCYQGQLLQTNLTGGTGGHVQIADVASEAHENDLPVIGIAGGVVDASATYSSTYFGDGSTYTTTQGTVATNGPAEVKVILTIPWVTLVKAPIYNAAFGTALTTLVETSGSAGGTVVTHANQAVTDIADDFATVYCRTGANKGIYRVVTTGATGSQTVTVPFPYAIAVGDTFVVASCVLGLGGLGFPATANCIDGNNAISSYYDVFYHDINLAESGKEYAVFTFMPKACGPIAA